MSTIQPSNAKLLTLQYDAGKIRTALVALSKIPAAERKALARSINRALYGTRTDVVADLRQRTVLKAGRIRKGITVQPIYWFSHSWAKGHVNVASSRIPLTEYKVMPLRQTAQKRRLPQAYKHLTYRLSPGGRTFDNAPQVEGRSKLFAVQGKNSNKLFVFARFGAKRTDLAGETGPSLQAFYARSDRQQHIMKSADARFRKALAQNISHLGGGLPV